MHVKAFYILLAIFCIQTQIKCMDGKTLQIQLPDVPESTRLRPEPIVLPFQQEDSQTIERIINTIHLNIYPRQACKDALIFAFRKMREKPTIKNLTPAEEQKLNPLILVKEMWKLYSTISEPDDRTLVTYYDTDLLTVQRIRSDSARNLVYAAMHLKNEDTIYNLHRHRLILAGTTSIFAALAIFSNLVTYFGFCHT